MLRFVLLLALLVVLPGAGEADDARLGYDIRPSFQEVRLRLDAREADYTGSTTMTLQVEHAVDRLRFHAENMELTEVTLTGPEGEVDHEITNGPIGIREMRFSETCFYSAKYSACTSVFVKSYVILRNEHELKCDSVK